MTNNITSLTVAAMTELYNQAVYDYAPAGFEQVDKFKSRSHAIDRIEALCAAGNLAVSFYDDVPAIIDVMTDSGNASEDSDEGADEGADEGDAPTVIGLGLSDAKGGIARSGFAYGSDDWLRAHPRGTPEREAYRKARRQAAREMRKAERNAKLALLEGKA